MSFHVGGQYARPVRAPFGAYRQVVSLLVGVLLAGAGCSLLVDTSDIDQGCGAGRKLCDGQCVNVSDPAYGCDPARCEPCRLDNAIPACNGETCVIDACLLGFGCPTASGCAVNVLTSSANCGTCGTVCADNQSCSNGVCAPQ